ncbi:MAG: hypothetical protein NT080_08185, partial [Spirochaetes bacterium]|nr:hypothetical protein [Spirochaetota bacterium]
MNRALMLMFLVFFTAAAWSADKVWDNDALDNDWMNPANWDLDALPVAGDNIAINIAANIINVPATVFLGVTIAGDAVFTGTLNAQSASVSGNRTVTFSNGLSLSASLDLGVMTGGSLTLGGSLTAQGVTTAAANYTISLNGGGTVDTDTTFLNTGALVLGNDAGDTLTFTGGLDTAACSGTSVAGIVQTTATQMDLGAV